ncbi:Hypothetical_protein [Hexamita inflata]|uniref:Hypothetical_protein n=1 Tax=Hexamita inflata TaxID=28002 RepID=A0AA86NUC1_9EUKA|nr:Hypothetical protein HINF_LOCUS13723 [Hexamita inflata]
MQIRSRNQKFDKIFGKGVCNRNGKPNLTQKIYQTGPDLLSLIDTLAMHENCSGVCIRTRVGGSIRGYVVQHGDSMGEFKSFTTFFWMFLQSIEHQSLILQSDYFYYKVINYKVYSLKSW